MKHYYFRPLLVIIMCMIGAQASAKIFAENADGVTIYYYFNSDHTELAVTSGGGYYDDVKYTGRVVIPESVTYNGTTYPVTSIGSGAFANSQEPVSVVMPNSITTIQVRAFEYCNGLNSIVIPNSVTKIDNGAFFGCYNLASVVIGTGVLSIGSDAFSFPAKVIWLTNTPPTGYQGNSGMVNYVANEQYTKINRIVYPFLSSMFEVDGVRYVPVSPSERTCDAIDCVYDESAANTRISSTVTYQGISMKVQQIQPYLCYHNNYVERLVCDTEGEIPTSAFAGCVNMETAILGDAGNLDVESFKGLYIGSNIGKIGDNVFAMCKKLSKLVIADRDTELSLGYTYSHNPLFADCPLESVYIGGNITYQTSEYCGYSPFYRNTTLKTVVITDKETEISDNEFYGCTSLESFTIGDGVTKFGDWAFSGCSSLKSLSFGSQLQTIGKEAFSDCTTVTKIVSRAAVPPTCGTQALDDINKWSCMLVVPTGSMAAYQQADQWKEFFFVQEGAESETAIKSAAAATQRVPDVCYSLDGKRLSQPQKGLNIVRMSNGTTKKVIMK